MSECAANYPSELPLGCVHQLLLIVRGGKLAESVPEFAAAAWGVIGYCLKVFVGEPAPVINGLPPGEPPAPSVRAEVAELSALLSTPASAAAGSSGGDLLTLFIVPLLVAALKKLLATWGE